MRGLITIGIFALAFGTGCNQKSERKKNGNGDATGPYQSTPNTTTPTTPTTPTNTTLNGRNCTTNELFGGETRRIIITAQHGVHQPGQMQIVNPDGTSHMYNLQPANKYLLMPRSDNYDVFPANSGNYNQGSNYNNQNQNQNQNQTGSGGVFGGLFNGNGSGSTGGEAGHVTVTSSGNVYLRGVEYFDNSSGTVKPEKITGKAVCT